MPLPQFISSHIPHIIIGAVLSFPVYKVFRWTLEKISGWVWDSTVGALRADRQRLANCDANLQTMMTNHLPHLQESLNTLIDKQEQSNLIAAESAGYLKGILEKK